MNKKWWSIIIWVLVLVLTIPVLAGCSSPVKAQDATPTVQVSQQPQGIWVSGTGEVSIVPDIATLNLGVVVQGTSIAEAQSEASEGMTKVMQALTSNGIAAKDIQTGRFSINQETRWDDEKEIETPVGYEVTNRVIVKIKDTSKVSDIIDSAIEAGGDLIRITGISFSVEDPAKYYLEAREKAITAAKEKAENLAQLSGVTLGNPTYIAEDTQYTPTSGSYANFAIAAAGENLTSSMLDTSPISAGETKITLSVQVAYSLIP